MASHPSPAPVNPNRSPAPDDDTIDLRQIWLCLMRGLPKTIGLALLGFVVAAAAYFAAGPFLNVSTTSRVVFSFPGYEKGEYPDKSKFQSDDLRAPEIIAEALKRQGLDTSEKFQGIVRSALSIEGLIPPNIIKERDRLRASGQPIPALIPDEYQIILSLPRKFPLGSQQREALLIEITSVYREKFQRTYATPPPDFGNAFESLQNADFFEYEIILNTEIQNILAYLGQIMDPPQAQDKQSANRDTATVARTFRSQVTNFSFTDLIKQTQLFAQLRLNEVLGLIRQHGLSKDRSVAMVKMDYYLRILEDRERKAEAEEKIILNLLDKTQARGEGYVLGIKSQVVQNPIGSTPLLDQGLIDSLLANDAYNFLVREALKAGLTVKSIQAEKAVLLERRKSMQSFLEGNPSDQSAIIEQVLRSLANVETAYHTLIDNIRKTHADFARQQFADAVRMSMQPITGSFYVGLIKAGIVGLLIGTATGVGLSLLGVGSGRAGSQP